MTTPLAENKVIVNSWNEWDPLKHVIVGRADGTHISPSEPASEMKIPEDSDMVGIKGARKQDTVDAANEELDNLVSVLEGRGVKVDRPTPIDFSEEVKTPDFTNETMFGCMPPRDVLLTVGREMVEATMSFRSRWFEYLCYRPLLKDYWMRDTGMKWEAAPKPRLSDASYKMGYLSEGITMDERLAMVADRNFVTQDWEEPLFDAADVCRMGKDLFVQHGLTVNLAGIEWLRRHFPDHRVHAVNFPGDPYPIHIDATFVPLRPGLIINNPNRRLPDAQKAIFKKNDWEIIDAAPPSHQQPPPLCYSSVWLSMNVLMLDPKTVVAEATEHYQLEQFDKLGFEVIPVPFRKAYPFGGGLHCSTADVYREGDCEDYFPKQ